jgi:hypothetical protein
MRGQTTARRKLTPPVQICHCPGGGGHLWAGLNPRWYNEVGHPLNEEHWCPDHQEEKVQMQHARIGDAVSAAATFYNELPLPETRKCFNPAPTAHEAGAVLPAAKFYLRKSKKRRDGSQSIKLDAQCKACRREQENERRANWTKEQKRRASKAASARKRKRRRELRKQTDKQLELAPLREWLEQFVKDTGTTHDSIEHRAGLSKSTVSALLTRNGKVYTNQSTVEKIAQALDRPYLLSQLYGEKR